MVSLLMSILSWMINCWHFFLLHKCTTHRNCGDCGCCCAIDNKLQLSRLRIWCWIKLKIKKKIKILWAAIRKATSVAEHIVVNREVCVCTRKIVEWNFGHFSHAHSVLLHVTFFCCFFFFWSKWKLIRVALLYATYRICNYRKEKKIKHRQLLRLCVTLFIFPSVGFFHSFLRFFYPVHSILFVCEKLWNYCEQKKKKYCDFCFFFKSQIVWRKQFNSLLLSHCSQLKAVTTCDFYFQ